MNIHIPPLQGAAKSPAQVTAALSRVLGRMPPEISKGLTPEQLGALDKALDFNNPTPHPVNLRITLFGLFYLVVLAGSERRSPNRRDEERYRHPLHTPGNIALLTGTAMLCMSFGYTLRLWIMAG